jgi:hypothetical protein
MTRREQRNLIIALLIFLFVNFSIPFSIGHRWAKAGQASSTWPKTEGRIVSTNAPVTSSGAAASVTYAYDVRGETFQHSRLRYGFLGDIREEMRRLTNGAAVTVSYHPADPAQAVLMPGASTGTQAMKTIGTAGMIGAAFAIFLVWRLFKV